MRLLWGVRAIHISAELEATLVDLIRSQGGAVSVSVVVAVGLVALLSLRRWRGGDRGSEGADRFSR